MLSQLLRQLFNSFGIFFRTIRAFFTRKLTGAWSRLRRITNVSRHATKVATETFQGAAAAMKKPTKRSDYIETKRLFISKSFLLLLGIGIVLLVLLIYFVVWPFLLSTFFTAKFYQGDEKLQDWSGRVIVYYDEEKKQPMYSGTLKDGVLQGRGKEYDENGLVTYDGNFVDGLRSGNGSCYEAGVLVYEGQFANGLYEGTGSLYEDGVLAYYGAFSAGLANGMGTAYADGAKCYEGAFVEGLYQGEGTQYYHDGTVKYKGSFEDGLYSGTGTSYYADGTRSYVGGFADGLREGEGTEYNEEGKVRYKGGFAAGLYEGSGSYYLDSGDVIQAEFAAGVTDGSIQWYRDGELWYEGGAENLTPDGFGTLYSDSGKAIYAGEFDQGTLDGSWLLTLTAQDLRTAFGEATLTETDSGTGFRIVNEELELWALCSYQQEGSDPQVYEIWFQPEDDSSMTALLPWETGSDFNDWALIGHESTTQSASLSGSARYADGVVEGNWWLSRYTYEGYTCTGLSRSEDGVPQQLHWVRTGQIPTGGAGSTDSTLAQAQERLDELMAALEGVGGGSGGSASASQGDVERMLGLMLTAQDGQDLMDALVDYYTYSQMATLLEESRTLMEQRLDEEQILLSRGQSSQTAVDALSQQVEDLDRLLTQYKASAQQGKLTATKLSKLDPSGYNIQAALLTFDPVSLKVSELYDAALTYAKAVAAQRYEVDTDQLELEVKTAVIDLNLDYEDILAAQKAVEQAQKALETATTNYAKGTVDKAELYDAQCALNQAAADLYQAIGDFTHQANHLNTLSGGWIAQEQDWMADTFQVIFQSEIRRGEEAAAALEEERQEQEAQASQAIEEEAAQSAKPQASPSPQPAASASPTPSATPSAESAAPSASPARR